MLLAEIVVALLCLAWVLVAASAAVSARALGILEDVTTEPRTSWPRLSVVVPACNEAATLREALSSLMAQDYPDLEIVVVDDRSDDATPQIVDELAATDDRVTALHIDELPDGWLGKIHAMHVAVARSTGELLLFTDADVHFERDALRRGVSALSERELDHLTVIPQVTSESRLLDACMGAFGTLLLAAVRPHRMELPHSDAVLGVGAFNLVRRSAFDRTPGFEWLRMEIADDTGLALMLRRAGARQAAMASKTAVSLTWYHSIGGLVRGLEKNMFGVAAHYRVAEAVAKVVVLFALSVAPLLAFVPPLASTTWPAGVAAFVALVLSGAVTSRSLGRRPLSALLLPFGVGVFAYALLRSMLAISRDGGVTWRGTHYPLDALRRLQRFRL